MNDEHDKYFEITDNLLPSQIHSISSTLKSFRMADEGETADGGKLLYPKLPKGKEEIKQRGHRNYHN